MLSLSTRHRSFSSCFPTLSDRCRKIVIFLNYCLTSTRLTPPLFLRFRVCLSPSVFPGGKTRKTRPWGLSLSAIQHLASSTRKKPAFGCKQLSGCIHGAPPHTPPKGTFCKKSPWESRKTAFDFYCLIFHRSLSRYQKPAYMPLIFDGL